MIKQFIHQEQVDFRGRSGHLTSCSDKGILTCDRNATIHFSSHRFRVALQQRRHWVYISAHSGEMAVESVYSGLKIHHPVDIQYIRSHLFKVL